MYDCVYIVCLDFCLMWFAIIYYDTLFKLVYCIASFIYFGVIIVYTLKQKAAIRYCFTTCNLYLILSTLSLHSEPSLIGLNLINYRTSLLDKTQHTLP